MYRNSLPPVAAPSPKVTASSSEPFVSSLVFQFTPVYQIPEPQPRSLDSVDLQ